MSFNVMSQIYKFGLVFNDKKSAYVVNPPLAAGKILITAPVIKFGV